MLHIPVGENTKDEWLPLWRGFQTTSLLRPQVYSSTLGKSYCLFPNGDVEQSPGLAAVTRKRDEGLPRGSVRPPNPLPCKGFARIPRKGFGLPKVMPFQTRSG